MTIGFTGDVAFSKYFKDGFNNDGIISDKIKEYLSDTDYTVVNVEAPVTDATVQLKKPLVHINGIGCVDFFKKINGNVWNVANNHSMDCGIDGLRDTKRYAQENGYLTVGAGENSVQARKPLILSVAHCGEEFSPLPLPYARNRYKKYLILSTVL